MNNTTSDNKDDNKTKNKTQQYYYYLKILNLKDFFTISELKEAYREKISNSHPDKNSEDPNATEKTIEINAAFEFLENFIINESKNCNDSTKNNNEKSKNEEKEELIKNACDLLGVNRNYTKKQLKTAFGIFELKYQDDKKNENFKKIKTANKFLLNLLNEKEEKDYENEREKRKNEDIIQNNLNISDDDSPKGPEDWHGYAKIFLKRNKLLRSEEVWFLYEKGLWKPIDGRKLREKANYIHETDNLKNRSEITAAAETDVENWDEPPKWDQLPVEEIAFEDFILNVKTKQLRIPVPEDYLTTKIPHKYNPKATCPIWVKSLNDWLSNDQILALQEFFGYILSGSIAYRKALLLYGKRGAGKTRPLKVAEFMVGKKNVCVIDPKDMENPGVMAQIYGKKLNAKDELGESSKLGEGFRAIIDCNSISINPKYLSRISITPTAKHIFTTNILPKMGIDSQGNDANLDRLLLIQFLKEITVRDPQLINKLYAEIQGIINWSIEGLIRLIDRNGEFTKIKDNEELLSNYKYDNMDEVEYCIYATNKFEFDPSYSIKKDIFIDEFKKTLNQQYSQWSDIKIGKRIVALGFKSDQKKEKGKETRYYFGFRLKQEEVEISFENKNTKEQLNTNDMMKIEPNF